MATTEKKELIAVELDEATGLPAARYCRVDVVAKLFGLSVRRCHELTQEGIIPTIAAPKGGPGRARCYDLVPTIQKYVEYLSQKAFHKRGPTDREAELKTQKLEADIALKESQGELHRLKTAIAAGEYISIEEVKLDYARFFVSLKKFSMSIPSRTVGMIAGQLDPLEARRMEKELSAEIAALLDSFVVAGVTQKEAKAAASKNAKEAKEAQEGKEAKPAKTAKPKASKGAKDAGS